jgi:hypothetical protein
MAMAGEESSTEASPSNPTKETAKWLVVSFGALGAALIGSASIQDLAKLSPSGQTEAYQGLALALLGVVLVVVPAAVVMATFPLSLSRLARSDRRFAKYRRDKLATEDEFLLGSWGDVETLVNRHALYQYERLKAHAEINRLAVPEVPSQLPEQLVASFESDAAGKLRPAQDRLAEAKKGLDSTSPYIAGTADYLAEKSLSLRFIVAIVLLVIGVAVASVGAARFATAETVEQAEDAEAESSPVVDLDALPVTAQLVVEDEAKDRFQPLLGNGCSLSSLAVVVLGVDGDTSSVLVLPQDGCVPRQIEISDEQGNLSGTEVACRLTEPTEVPTEDGFGTEATGVSCS